MGEGTGRAPPLQPAPRAGPRLSPGEQEEGRSREVLAPMSALSPGHFQGHGKAATHLS